MCFKSIVSTGCVIKIRTNFNLNFLPYCASAKRHSWRLNLMLLVNNHKLKMAAAPDREHNRRAAIIEGFRAGRSPTEIIRFFGYPKSTVYDVVTKYSTSEQSNKSFSMPARKS